MTTRRGESPHHKISFVILALALSDCHDLLEPQPSGKVIA